MARQCIEMLRLIVQYLSESESECSLKVSSWSSKIQADQCRVQSSRLPTIHQKIPTSWCFVRNKRLTGKPLHKPRTNRAIRTPHNISGVEKKSPLKAWKTYSDSDLTNFSQEDIFSLFFIQESYSPQPHRWHEQLCKRKMARRGIVRWKSLGGVIRPSQDSEARGRYCKQT